MKVGGEEIRRLKTDQRVALLHLMAFTLDTTSIYFLLRFIGLFFYFGLLLHVPVELLQLYLFNSSQQVEDINGKVKKNV